MNGLCNKAQLVTRNIRKPGIVGKFNFCTFTQNCNGLIGWSFEIPAYAYCQPLANIIKISINEKNSINYCITWTLH